jgi:hypothetical protein
MKSSTGFPQIPLLVFVGILINSALLYGVSQKCWDVKPCMEWSIEEVEKMINDSPWVEDGLKHNTSASHCDHCSITRVLSFPRSNVRIGNIVHLQPVD